MYKVRRIIYEEKEIDRDELVTIAEASEILDISIQGVGSALNRGEFTEVIDPYARFHGKRLLLRSEVEAKKHN